MWGGWRLLCVTSHVTPVPPCHPLCFHWCSCADWAVCVLERDVSGREGRVWLWGLMGARAAQGQCLCRARDCPHWHAHTHTCKHRRAGKNRGLLWTLGPVVPSHYSHTLYHTLPFQLFLPLTSLWLFVYHSLLCFPSSSDVTWRSYLTWSISSSVPHFLPLFSFL